KLGLPLGRLCRGLRIVHDRVDDGRSRRWQWNWLLHAHHGGGGGRLRRLVPARGNGANHGWRGDHAGIARSNDCNRTVDRNSAGWVAQSFAVQRDLRGAVADVSNLFSYRGKKRSPDGESHWDLRSERGSG